MIQLQNVGKVYRTDKIETLALSEINLTIEAGSFVAIMGPSGCGKSTLLNMIGLLDKPSDGGICMAGQDVSALSDREMARFRNEHIGFVFQSFHLISDLKVIDNVEIPLLYRPGSHRERRRKAAQALDRVGLSSRLNHFPTQLSGGQQQRVAIARAIVGEPDLILADEPTGNLDSHMGEQVMEILEDLNRAQSATVVMVTHDDDMAQRGDRTIRLFDGRQVEA